MVARVRNLTASSSVAAYFHEEGGYYTGTKGDREAARVKAMEHPLASAWHGQAALGLKAAETWLALDATRTLLVAPTHELRAEINAAGRAALAEEGVLRGQTLRIDRLVGLGMTRAEMG